MLFEKMFVSETSQSLKKCLYEHKRVLQIGNNLNAFVSHQFETTTIT